MKLKIAGAALIGAAVIICIVYGIVAGVTFGREDYGLYSGADAPEARAAELTYNALRYTSGAYKYCVQAYVDIGKLTEGLSPEEKAEKETDIKGAVAAAEQIMKKFGARIENDKDPYYFSAVTAEFASATDMDLALGNDGYEVYTSSAEVYNGFWYSDYVITVSDPFASESGYLREAKNVLADAVGAENLDLVYNYGSAYGTNTVESNADYVYKYKETSAGRESYVHEFRRGADEAAKAQVLVQHSPNTVSWYLLIIVGVLLLSGTVLLITGALRGKNRSYYER